MLLALVPLQHLGQKLPAGLVVVVVQHDKGDVCGGRLTLQGAIAVRVPGARRSSSHQKKACGPWKQQGHTYYYSIEVTAGSSLYP